MTIPIIGLVTLKTSVYVYINKRQRNLVIFNSVNLFNIDDIG